MTTAATTLSLALGKQLNGLFTRTFVSAATYVFEAQPYEVAEDAALLEQMQGIKDLDRDHATLLANLLRSFDCIPEPGVFPYWYRDLNYLTVPYMATFVVESLGEDLALIDAVAAQTPDAHASVRATLGVLRSERAAVRDRLAPAAAEALIREAAQYADASRVIRETRESRLAAEKAALAAAKAAERKAKADAKAKAEAAASSSAVADPTAGMPDPNEEGISSKEKAKRTMMIKRAKKKAAEAAAPATPAADPTAGMPDPNEEGISSKEKAKRTMLIKRAKKKAAEAAAPAATTSAVDLTAGMPDPNEEGISSKEKAKRTMMIKRARKAAEAAAPATPAATTSAVDLTAGMPDPSEEGISSKEKAKRTMMIRRAKKSP